MGDHLRVKSAKPVIPEPRLRPTTLRELPRARRIGRFEPQPGEGEYTGFRSKPRRSALLHGETIKMVLAVISVLLIIIALHQAVVREPRSTAAAGPAPVLDRPHTSLPQPLPMDELGRTGLPDPAAR